MDKMKPVTFDGWILVLLGICPIVQAWITGDEAAKFIAPFWIFIVGKGLVPTVSAALVALKAYRSTQFAHYKLNGGSDPSYSTPQVVAAPAAPADAKIVTTTQTTIQSNEKTTAPVQPAS